MAYTPVTFDPLPVGRPTDRANIPAAQTPQALVLDGNFAKVNTALAGLPPYMATVGRTVSLSITSGLTADGNFHTIAASLWPALTFSVPACAGVLATLGTRALNTKATTGIWISASATGSAFKLVQSSAALRVFVQPNTGAHSTTHLWLTGTDIVVGGVITLTPQFMIPVQAAGGTSVEYGELTLTAVG
jgi:hypothetical protein